MPEDPIRFIISFTKHQIVATDANRAYFFGFPASEVHGADIGLFCGPGTDFASLKSCIESAKQEDTTIETLLYCKDGSHCTVKIACSPYITKNKCLAACLMCIELGSELTCCKLLDYSKTCKGTMNYFHQHRTVCSSTPSKFCSDPSKDHVKATGDDKGAVEEISKSPTRHHLDSLLPSSLFSKSAPDLCTLVTAPSQRSAVDRPQSTDRCPTDVRCHFVSPRRKTSDGIFTSSPQPIVVTLDTLQALRGLSVGLAAEKLGISPTAFKRACRALGMRRWAYQRRSERVSAKELRRMTNAAHRAVAISAHGSFKAEARAVDEGAEADIFSWIVPPMPTPGPLGSGLEQEIELCSEEEALTGPAVFEWPRYG